MDIKINPYRLKIRDRGKRKLKKKIKELKYMIRTNQINSKEAKKIFMWTFWIYKICRCKKFNR